MVAEGIRTAIAGLMPRARENLERLVRIPSVAFPGFEPGPVRDGAEATADILRSAGLPGVRLIELPGGYPAVFGELPAPEGAPTVLLYAHYDVQPAGPDELWDTPAFEPVVVEGRLYGRGSADDKSGIVIHAAALSAFVKPPPVGVKVLIEGEEESTTEHLPRFIRENRELLTADIIVVADSGNWRTGEPTLTTTIRGVVDCTVEVRTLERPVHSGGAGGAVPDALVALIRMLATLHDDRGNVAIEGLHRLPGPDVDYPEQALRAESLTLPGVELVGDGSIAERLWTKPAVNVIGIDAPTVHGARNILVDRARAQVSLRLAPGDDPARAQGMLTAHLTAAAPWGVNVTISNGEPGEGYAAQTGGPAYEAARRAMQQAYGKPAVAMGSGGSVPLIPQLAHAFPNAEILLMGAMDDRSATHAQNESVDLAELERASLAEALLLAHLGPGSGAGSGSGASSGAGGC